MYVQEQGVGSRHNMTVFEVAYASFRERPDLSLLGKGQVLRNRSTGKWFLGFLVFLCVAQFFVLLPRVTILKCLYYFFITYILQAGHGGITPWRRGSLQSPRCRL